MKSDGESSGGGLPPLAERCLLIFAVNQRLNFEAENSTNAPLCCRGFSAMIELQEAETRALVGRLVKVRGTNRDGNPVQSCKQRQFAQDNRHSCE